MHAEEGGRGEAARRAALWHVTRTHWGTEGGAGRPHGDAPPRGIVAGHGYASNYRPFDASLTLSSTCASYFTAKCEK